MNQPSLKRYALLSLVAALATIGLKGGAYLLTGSVGLLSDAAESLVNLLAALVALVSLSVAERPADEEHAYGHTKAEYFSSGFEGALVLMAAVGIGATAVERWLDPRRIEEVGLGVAISLVASAVNFVVARHLFTAGRRYGSITLEADAEHLMTDVWTSLAVVAGLGATVLTGWERLDALIAVAVAINIVYTGAGLLRRSMLGLLDTALPEQERRSIAAVLEAHVEDGVQFHALRTRQAGVRRFVSLHVLVPGEWTVQRGHDYLEALEEEIRAAVPHSSVFTHLEPLEDPLSWEDERLERRSPG
ncbi:MAG: cation diffusion facilitator family transporter [Gemmatimonadota bacterium]|nr:cation diffusion facilitator family transporter [Gemmatimonadota bacterium]